MSSTNAQIRAAIVDAQVEEIEESNRITRDARQELDKLLRMDSPSQLTHKDDEISLAFEPHYDAVQQVSAEKSIRIARGATRQILLIGTGECLNAAIHKHERIYSMEIIHSVHGKVSVICHNLPFPCSLEFQRSGSSWNGYYRSYTTSADIAANIKVNLRASQRSGSVWVLSLGLGHYLLEIRPGKTLVVTHKVG